MRLVPHWSSTTGPWWRGTGSSWQSPRPRPLLSWGFRPRSKPSSYRPCGSGLLAVLASSRRLEERQVGGAYGLLASLNQVGPIAAQYVASRTGHAALGDGDADMHELFLSNFFAQTKALAFGKTSEEVRAEGTPEAIVSARVFTGNRPTTSIMAPALTPSVLGQLIALYEHITFVEGAVWGIDSFDQWGVELGKVLAKQILPAIEGSSEALDAQDQSTRALIEYYRANRTK